MESFLKGCAIRVVGGIILFVFSIVVVGVIAYFLRFEICSIIVGGSGGQVEFCRPNNPASSPVESTQVVLQPTNAPQPVIVFTDTPIPQPPTATPTAISPVFTPDPSCMTGYVPFREMGANGETKTYIRCPVGQVQYSIQIDDILNSIVLSCPNQPDKNISFSKNEARSAGQLLNSWDSEVFRSEQGCKVLLTITNNYAEMGYTVWQEVIAP